MEEYNVNSMTLEEHLAILNQGVEAWNKWRAERPDLIPDLSGAHLGKANLTGINLYRANLNGTDLSGAFLREADLRRTDLSGATLHATGFGEANLNGSDLSNADLNGAYLGNATLTGARLNRANLSGAKLHEADLNGANLYRANLSGAYLDRTQLVKAFLKEANLSRASLVGANFTGADLSGASLHGANLTNAMLVEADFTHADLTNSSIYGISAWNVKLQDATQNNLIITPKDEPTITVVNLKIAQFIYLLLNNTEIRDVIDTIAKKAVLILGCFTPERKVVLDALKNTLRIHGYLPILFDFDKPSSQDLTETVSTLAHLSRFIIVDLTDPSSVPYEVGTIASNHIRPIQALFRPSDKEKRVFTMFPDLIRRYHWVLPPYEYQDQDHLLASLQAKVIEPAEQKAQELEKRQ